MAPEQTETFGFKRLTSDNWLKVDPAWAGVVMSASRSDPSEAWVHDLVQSELAVSVPLNIRKLFEIVRDTLVYSLMFYPLGDARNRTDVSGLRDCRHRKMQTAETLVCLFFLA
jgi:hypothetical protein